MTEVLSISHHHPTKPDVSGAYGAQTATPGKARISDASGIDNTKPVTYPISEMHDKLLKCLKSNVTLDCVYADVKNESYWYHQRSLLGPKRHNSILLTQNQSTYQWEANIYKYRADKETGDMKPLKTFVSSHKTKISAMKHGEAACKERDANPCEKMPIGSVEISKIKSTHFKLLVVSSKFYRLSNFERLSMIWEALIEDIGETIDTSPQAGLGKCAPTRIKMGSVFGRHMAALEPFRLILPSQPLWLLVEARTPSEWRADLYLPQTSERYGKTHLSITNSSIPKEVKPASHMEKIKKLAYVPDGKSKLFKSSSEKGKVGGEKISLSETLGMDPEVSGLRYKKTGGIYGHFFKDLSPLVKDMLLERYTSNKIMIQQESNKPVNRKEENKKKKVDTFQPKTTMSMLRKKIEDNSNFPEYDKGTNSESEMMDELFLSAKRVERVTIRCQRMWRLRQLTQPARRVWRRKFATITIQRVFRGIYSRAYTQLLKKLMPLAATRVQRLWRKYKSGVLILKWKAISYRLTRVVWPKMKRFLRNCFWSWTSRQDYGAVPIQSMARMWLCRNRYLRHMAQKAALPLPTFYHAAALHIQRIIRGRKGRAKFHSIIEGEVFRRINIPCSIKLQRVYRGYRGRLRTLQKRREIKMANRIQRAAATYVQRVWAREVAYHKHRKVAATQIQRVYRGKLDREIYIARKAHHWYFYKYIPAIIKVQSIARGFKACKRVKRLRKVIGASNVIKAAYKVYKRRLVALEKWRAMQLVWINTIAAKLQKIVRRFLARLKYPSLLLIHNGRVVMAVKVIWRAWVNYCYAKRLQLMMDDNRVRVVNEKLAKIRDTRKGVEADMVEIDSDIAICEKAISALNKRVKELDTFIIESEMRLPALEKAMENLQAEDFEHGWADAYRSEYSTLTYQQIMCKEEMRLRRNYHMKRSAELTALYGEKEEAALELDHLGVVEMECMEALRRAEVGRIDRRVIDKKQRSIRFERCKWKIESIRSHVIRRNRKSYSDIIAKSKKDRDIKYASTLSFEHRQKQRDKEDLITNILLNASSRVGFDIKPYEEYATPLQDTMDAALENTMALLRGLTLDERAKRVRDRSRLAEKSKTALRGGQFAALKRDDV